MVGYEKNDSMSSQQLLIAGCVSGVITRFVTQPMDVIKLRTQLQKNRFGDSRFQWLMLARQILKEEGITAFWQGHNLGQVYSILSVSSQFYVYETATKYASSAPVGSQMRQALVFLSGIVAGCVSTSLAMPFEVIRVRQIVVKDQYKGLMRGAREVYRTGGVFAFYEGLSAALLQMGPQVGISFCVFGFVQPLLLQTLESCRGKECSNKPKPENILVASSIAGSVAGFTSKTLTYPFDLAKRRLQIGSHKDSVKHKPPSTSRDLVKCTRLVECLVHTWKTEGIRGLYRGWNVTIWRAQVAGIVTYTSYELICNGFRRADKNASERK